MNGSMARSPRIGAHLRSLDAAYLTLCLLLTAAFLLGGSARGDVQSLIVLRPLGLLALGLGLSSLRLSHVRQNTFVCVMGVAFVALPALQLVPLPYEVWSQLPGRALIAEIDRTAGIGQIWRPFSMTPDATLNALYATALPLAVLVLGIQLDTERLGRLLPLVLALGAASGILGLFQLMGEPGGPLYPYRVTNPNEPVGLFANRNHYAWLIACMLPMIAVWASAKRQVAQAVALVIGLALVLLLLVAGSRAGLVAGAVAIAATPLILQHKFRRAGAPPQGEAVPAKAVVLAIAACVAGLLSFAVWLGRGRAWDRFFSDAEGQDRRLVTGQTVMEFLPDYFPWGTGMGSFESVFQVHETDALLRPTYMNHLHNDWLELALTGGLPAVLLLVAGVIAFAIRTWQLLGRDFVGSGSRSLARLGLLIVLLAALSSVVDYPLRVPSLAALFVVAMLWTGCPSRAIGSLTHNDSGSGKRRSSAISSKDA